MAYRREDFFPRLDPTKKINVSLPCYYIYFVIFNCHKNKPTKLLKDLQDQSFHFHI